MSKKTVERSVSVKNPDTQEVHWFHKGDTLPGWAEPLVTNPNVFIPHGQSRSDKAVVDKEVESMLTETSTATDYSKMNKAHLEALLADRGLAIGGTKQELIDRLKASDGASS